MAWAISTLRRDIIGPTTYGSSPSSRARLTATASWRWWRRQQPVIRAERILPFSLIARRSVPKSL